MSGMDRKTGQLMRDDVAHMRQSILDILTTPIGSRVMNREYGSRLFDLIDASTQSTIDFYAATAEAIERWEPRFKLQTVEISAIKPGELELSITGVYKPAQTPMRFPVEIMK